VGKGRLAAPLLEGVRKPVPGPLRSEEQAGISFQTLLNNTQGVLLNSPLSRIDFRKSKTEEMGLQKFFSKTGKYCPNQFIRKSIKKKCHLPQKQRDI
jgi:hypothetical protein